MAAPGGELSCIPPSHIAPAAPAADIHLEDDEVRHSFLCVRPAAHLGGRRAEFATEHTGAAFGARGIAAAIPRRTGACTGRARASQARALAHSCSGPAGAAADDLAGREYSRPSKR